MSLPICHCEKVEKEKNLESGNPAALKCPQLIQEIGQQSACKLITILVGVMNSLSVVLFPKEMRTSPLKIGTVISTTLAAFPASWTACLAFFFCAASLPASINRERVHAFVLKQRSLFTFQVHFHQLVSLCAGSISRCFCALH